MLENLKNTIHQSINELFVAVALDEMAGDISAYKEKLKIIADVAGTLGISTEIATVTLNLKE